MWQTLVVINDEILLHKICGAYFIYTFTVQLCNLTMTLIDTKHDI